MRVSVKRCGAAALVIGLPRSTIQLTDMIAGATIKTNIEQDGGSLTPVFQMIDRNESNSAYVSNQSGNA